MPPPRAGPSNTEWNRHKALIRRRYLVDEVSLKELFEELVQKGLTLTLKQLEHQLRDWKFLRNIPSSGWQYAGHRIDKRRVAGKESLVVFNGKRVKPSTVKKETNRNRLVTYAAASAPSPSTPPDLALSVCTPPSLPLEFEWQSNLPWLSFQRNYPQLFSVMAGSQMRTHPTSISGDNMSIQYLHSTASNHILSQDLLRGDTNVMQIATGIAREMPESFSGEHLISAEILTRDSSQDVATYYQECTKLLFFRMSNCLDSAEPNDTKLGTIMKLLGGSGSLHAPLDPASQDDPTIASVLERLFGQFLDCCTLDLSETDKFLPGNALDIFKWILSSGFGPNTPVTDRNVHPGDSFRCITPLQYALSYGAFGAALSLVNAGADLNGASPRCPWTPLQLFIKRFPEDFPTPDGLSKLDFVEQLIKSGAQADAHADWFGYRFSPLTFAVSTGDIALVDLLVRNGADIDYRTRLTSHPFREYDTIMSQCAGNGTDESTTLRMVDYMLGAFQSQFPDRPIDSVITTDVMMAAAAMGYANVIQLLRSRVTNLDFYSNRTRGSALHVAALYNRVELCTLLLQWGHPIDGDGAVGPDRPDGPVRNKYPTPLHIACLRGNSDLVQLFTSHGADIKEIWNVESQFLHILSSSSLSWSPSEKLIQYLASPHSPCETLFREIYSHYKNVIPIQLALAADCHQREASLPCTTILDNAGASFPKDALYYAIRGSGHLFHTLIESGFDPNVQQGDHGSMSLFDFLLEDKTIKKEKREAYLVFLLARGAKPTSRNLVDAIELGTSWSLIKQMLNCGASLRAHGVSSKTPLEVALICGHDEIIEHLFEEFPSLAYDPSVLCAAVKGALVASSSSRIWVEHILHNRVEELLTAEEFRVEGAALAIAVRHKDWTMINLLTRFISIIPSTAILPLSVSQWKTTDPPKELGVLGRTWIDHSPGGWSSGGSRFWKSPQRWDCFIGSPIAPAVYMGDISFVERLLSRGFCPDMLSLSMAARKDWLSMARLLVSAMKLPQSLPGYGGTDPLQWAISRQNGDMFDLLKDFGLDIRSKAYITKDSGRSYLQTAVNDGSLGMINRLLESGANVNERPAYRAGATSLQIAAMRGFLGIAQLLISRGANVNARGSRTTLERAAEHGRIDMIQLLINHGAKTTGRAIDLAKKEGHFVAARMVERYWVYQTKTTG
ncbi:ankyrin repeat-containing domain protein [Podospora appendiculata]|uniref:Ankyrin repeat-containing domain protein n=1 Tax=Podospora appendiculata TaxID=314037 RepID=A0AAE1C9C7_9PEZI|nr:ankyrin repeat-containing domain protein [Podospora appendiculata]